LVLAGIFREKPARNLSFSLGQLVLLKPLGWVILCGWEKRAPEVQWREPYAPSSRSRLSVDGQAALLAGNFAA
jgi:hypothetical protein